MSNPSDLRLDGEEQSREDNATAYAARIMEGGGYTAGPANKHLKTRTAPVVDNAILDTILGVLSSVSKALCSAVMTLALLVSQAFGSGGEISASAAPIRALFHRAQAYLMGFGTDDVSVRLLDAGGLGLKGSASYTSLLGSLVRTHYALTKRLLLDQLAPADTVPIGPMAYEHCRTSFMEDVVEAFFLRQDGKQTNLVILNAGFNSTFYRFELPETVRCFEMDTEAILQEKRRVLDAAGVDYSHVTFIPYDAQSETWSDILLGTGISSGFERARATCILWAGGSMRMTPEGVEAALTQCRGLAIGSIIAFDFFGHWALKSAEVAKYLDEEKPCTFGVDESGVHVVVKNAQLYILDLVKPEDIARRYLPTHADGSTLGLMGDFGGFCVAGRAV